MRCVVPVRVFMSCRAGCHLHSRAVGCYLIAACEKTMPKRRKIAFIGAGNVGATCAHLCFLRSLGDIVLYDIIDGLPQGKALDMLESAPVLGIDVDVIGSTDIQKIE